MRTTLDSAGRLVIPREVRRQAGLRPGMELDVRWRDGRIEIEPAPLPVRLERRSRLLVAVPQRNVALLMADEVEPTREALQYSALDAAHDT
jgi:AbrB family looped-hinge helix DNA binding protein